MGNIKKKKAGGVSAKDGANRQSVYYGAWWKRHGKEHLAEEREARRQRRIEKDIPLLREGREKIWRNADSNLATSVLPSRMSMSVTLRGKTEIIVGYTINILAGLVSRNAQTVRMWEKQKFIPVTPYRDQYGRRLYTRKMIEAVCQAYDNEGGWLRRKSVYPFVLAAWIEQGVLKEKSK
jgi:hypothetical protein